MCIRDSPWAVTLRARRRSPAESGSRLPGTVLLAVAAAGAGLGAIHLLCALLPAGTTAPARTAVLAAAAVGLAVLRRRTGAAEAGWFAWAALAVAAARVLVQDLPAGQPVPLFAGFVLCGAALLAVSRLLGRAEAAPA